MGAIGGVRLLCALSVLCIPGWAWSQEEVTGLKDLDEMDLEELLQVRVTSASGVEESLLNAPSSMVVISARDIRERGYSSIADVLYDLPGFDLSLVNGTTYLLAYQRGYRTPWTQRTLFMVDGKVDNNLWSHAAELSRQYPLSNVEQIEVLYGPTSAVYGPNAFLGIINIITKDGRGTHGGAPEVTVNLEGGSFATLGVDAGVRGSYKDFAFALSGRFFRSDEPDLSDRWGFLSNDLYSDPDVWGPMLDEGHEHMDVPYGHYHDPTDDHGIIGRLSFKGVSVQYLDWVVKEGYGPYYAADRAQNNAEWNKASRRISVEHLAHLSARVRATTSVAYRSNRIWGTWTEAVPDSDPGMEAYSYISDTVWNSVSDSWSLREKVEWNATDKILVIGGMEYERKDLTKAYDIPGYWNVYSSTDPADDPGPHGYGTGVGHSTDETYAHPTWPDSDMPADNRVLTHDLGAYLLGIAEVWRFRFNVGARYDWNSVYGHAFNPRVSAMFKLNDKGAIKLAYGEAVQEPAPVQLWGGWSGRAANPDLNEEKVRTVELLGLYQFPYVFASVAVYYSHFDDVIMEDALNLGTRDAVGVEPALRVEVPNFIPSSEEISAYANYTFTYVRSSMRYDHDLGEWAEGDTQLGDIAPHKFNVGLDLPVWKVARINLRGNFVSRRQLYSANPLRGQGETLDPYFRLNLALSVGHDPVWVTFSVINLLDAEYFHPGPERADAGNDFDNRSLGFMNSVVPQPGRHFMVKLTADF